MTHSLEKVVRIVEDFVRTTRGTCPPLRAETQLLSEGLVDSFGLVELTTKLETDLGVKLPAGSLIPEDFETPKALHERLNAL